MNTYAFGQGSRYTQRPPRLRERAVAPIILLGDDGTLFIPERVLNPPIIPPTVVMRAAHREHDGDPPVQYEIQGTQP